MKTPEELAQKYYKENFNYHNIEDNFEEGDAAVVNAIVAEEIRKAFLAGYVAANK